MAGVRVLQGALISLSPCYQFRAVSGGNFFKNASRRKGDFIVAKKEQKKSKRPEGNVKEAKEAEGNFDLVEFLKGTKEELGKVVWPSRKQLISESAGVILMVTLVATIIYLFDNLFIWIAGQVF